MTKALSLWQPWATLIAIGAKRFETRSWKTDYRGPMVIHASKRFTVDERGICISQPFARVLKQAGYERLSDIPLGVALCIVDLVDILPTEKVRSNSYRAQIFVDELKFGDYSDGRFAWKLENVRRFNAPIPMRGAQGLFDCTLPEAAR
jgi:hypothetical protein